MSYEDLYYEIYEEMNKLNIKPKFDEELKRVGDEPKWKHKEVRDRWEEARQRTLKKYKNNENV